MFWKYENNELREPMITQPDLTSLQKYGLLADFKSRCELESNELSSKADDTRPFELNLYALNE